MVKMLDSQDTPPDVVVGAVSALIRAEHRHAASLAHRMSLPLTDALALYHVASEPLGASVLGERLGLTSGSVTALVDRLVARKLVRRTPNPTDRRSVLIEMTKTGHAQSWVQLQHFVGDLIGLVEQLSPTERASVDSFLRRLVAIVDADTDRMRSTE
jgi:MarR family transcriptional regulator, organic hydroperoxide resistance regulator